MQPYQTECMILDDEEMEEAATRVDWRGKNSFEVRSLFSSVKQPSEFPSAFQTFRPQKVPEFTPAEFPPLGQVEAPKVVQRQPLSYRQALLDEKKPEPSKEFRPLLECVDCLDLTPEFIVAFGVPLLPMPPFQDPYIDEDGDYRYAACTPPPERVGAYGGS